MTSDLMAAARRLLDGYSEAAALAAMGPAQPDQLLSALIEAARAADVALTVFFADLTGSLSFLDDGAKRDLAEGRLRLISVAGAVPPSLSPHIDYLPVSLWDMDRLVGGGELAIDILLARVVATADPAYAALGDMVGYTPTALGTGCRVGLEVVPGCALSGSQPVPLQSADVVVHGAALPPRSTPPRRATDEQETIGREVAALIPNGATIQMGLGAVPEAVIPCLREKTDLGIHSGILPAGIAGLIAAGAVTGSRKSCEADLHVATGVVGQGWSGADDRLMLRPVSHTHAPDRLLTQERLWAVNSAFEVDLAGQPNAEFVNGVRVASGGGQADFVRAAHASPGGAAVLALPSRSRRGRGRIVAELSAPHTPTSPGSEIDAVVTEYGTAWLRGRTAREKAAALITVAHPADRASLHHAISSS